MANRTASLLAQMFKFGIHRAIVENSPVMLLYRPGGKERARSRALSEEELKAFLQNLDDACRFQRLPHVLRVLLLTLQRRSELALAEWREFDLIGKTWTIPDAHAKTGYGPRPAQRRPVPRTIQEASASGFSSTYSWTSYVASIRSLRDGHATR